MKMNMLFMEINTVLKLILNRTHPSNTSSTKASAMKMSYDLFTFFCFQGVLLYISYILCQIVKLFLCMQITECIFEEHISWASLYQYVIYTALWCPFIWVSSFCVYRLTFLLILTCSVCKFGQSRSSWVAFQLKGFICGRPVDLPGHFCFPRHRRVSFLSRWQK